MTWTNQVSIMNTTKLRTEPFLSTHSPYIIGICGLFMVVIGLVTNTLNLFILSRKSMKSTTNKYLSALALCDMFVLIFSELSVSNNIIYDLGDSTDSYLSSIINEYSTSNNSDIQQFSLNEYFLYVYHKWVYFMYPKIYPIVYPFAIMFQICTVWISLGMSTDRFIAIHFPLKSLNFCTIKYAKRVITAIFIFSFFYSLPRFFEFYVHVDKVTLNNDTIEIVYSDFTEIGKSTQFRTIVYVYMYIFFQSVLPLILLSIINVGLLVSLKKSGKKLRKFSTGSEKSRLSSINSNSFKFINKDYHKRKDITLMMTTVVLLFIVLQFPAIMCNCFYGSNNYRVEFSKKESNSINNVCQIGNLFILTSSSTNFFSYCLFNKKFRRELIKFIRKLLCLKPNIKQMRRFSATTQNSLLLQVSNQFKNSINYNYGKKNKFNRSHLKKISSKFLYLNNNVSTKLYSKQESSPDSNITDFSLKSTARKSCIKNIKNPSVSIESLDIIKFSIKRKNLDNDNESSLVYV